ncbi:hypothetical protein [Phormidium sp. FACHB-1136]|nr:hypothetical protein [Phormidium sp. FACHB-1136]
MTTPTGPLRHSHTVHGDDEAIVTCANHRLDREVAMASDWFG